MCTNSLYHTMRCRENLSRFWVHYVHDTYFILSLLYYFIRQEIPLERNEIKWHITSAVAMGQSMSSENDFIWYIITYDCFENLVFCRINNVQQKFKNVSYIYKMSLVYYIVYINNLNNISSSKTSLILTCFTFKIFETKIASLYKHNIP